MSQDRVDNPYRPPASATNPAQRPSRRIGWRLYLGLLGLSYALVYWMLGVGWMQTLDVVDGAATLVGFTGLFGYAYRRRLGSAVFWKRWLPVQVAWDLLVMLYLTGLGVVHALPEVASASLAEKALQLLFVLPLYVALFRYGFRSPEVWRDA